MEPGKRKGVTRPGGGDTEVIVNNRGVSVSEADGGAAVRQVFALAAAEPRTHLGFSAECDIVCFFITITLQQKQQQVPLWRGIWPRPVGLMTGPP